MWLGEFASARSTYAMCELGDTTQYRNQVTALSQQVSILRSVQTESKK